MLGTHPWSVNGVLVRREHLLDALGLRDFRHLGLSWLYCGFAWLFSYERGFKYEGNPLRVGGAFGMFPVWCSIDGVGGGEDDFFDGV